MNITVNGQEVEILQPMTIQELLEHLKINPLAVVVETNQRIVTREDFKETTVQFGDKLEIIRYMAGG